MGTLRQALGGISGGRVLDVATWEGNFIQTLVENLKSYVEIIGIDAIKYTKAAGSVFCAENVRFCQMDAARLGFEEESFDQDGLLCADNRQTVASMLQSTRGAPPNPRLHPAWLIAARIRSSFRYCGLSCTMGMVQTR